MKSFLIRLYYALLVAVLIARFTDIFFNYSEETDQLITTSMFCLLGVGYIRFAFLESQKGYQLLFALCGMYLIIMNFIEKNDILTIIGIICILLPLVLRRIYKKKKKVFE